MPTITEDQLNEAFQFAQAYPDDPEVQEKAGRIRDAYTAQQRGAGKPLFSREAQQQQSQETLRKFYQDRERHGLDEETFQQFGRALSQRPEAKYEFFNERFFSESFGLSKDQSRTMRKELLEAYSTKTWGEPVTDDKAFYDRMGQEMDREDEVARRGRELAMQGETGFAADAAFDFDYGSDPNLKARSESLRKIFRSSFDETKGSISNLGISPKEYAAELQQAMGVGEAEGKAMPDKWFVETVLEMPRDRQGVFLEAVAAQGGEGEAKSLGRAVMERVWREGARKLRGISNAGTIGYLESFQRAIVAGRLSSTDIPEDYGFDPLDTQFRVKETPPGEMGIGNVKVPAPGTPEFDALSDDQKKALARIDKEMNYLTLGEMVKGVAEGSIDPAKGSNWYTSGVIGVAGMAPSIALMAGGPIGAGLNIAAYGGQATTDYLAEHPTASLIDAMNIGMATGVIQGLLDKIPTKIISGKTPFFSKWLSSPTLTKRGLIGRGAVRLGGGTVFETGQEFGQDVLAPGFVEELANVLKADLEDANWDKRLEAFTSADSMSELIPSIVMLSLISTGVGGINDYRGGWQLVRSKRLLTAAGLDQESVDAVHAAAVAGDAQETQTLLREAFVKLDKGPISEVLPKAQQKALETFKTELEEKKMALFRLGQGGSIPQVVPVQGGFDVVSEDGVKRTFATLPEAEEARSAYIAEQGLEVHEDLMAVMSRLDRTATEEHRKVRNIEGTSKTVLDSYVAGETSLEEATGRADIYEQVDDQGNAPATAAPKAETKAEPEFDIESEYQETKDRLALLSEDEQDRLAHLDIIGESSTEFSERVEGTTRRLTGTTTVTLRPKASWATIIEEDSEGDAKFKIKAGRRDWLAEKLFAVDADLRSGKRWLGKETSLFKNGVTRETATDQDLIEAYSTLTVGYFVGTAKKGVAGGFQGSAGFRKRYEGAIRTNAINLLDPLARVYRAVAIRATKIAKLRRDGKLDAELERELMRSVGMTEQNEYDTQVAKEKEAIQEELDPDGVLEDPPMTVVEEGEGFSHTVMPDGMTLSGPGTFSVLAHHGTPHKVDKFKTANIGTGEGQQAYGWGLYFGGAKSTGEYYKTVLSKIKQSQEWKRFSAENPDRANDFAEAVANRSTTLVDDVDLGVELQNALAGYVDYGVPLDGANRVDGNLYTVELLPNEDEFLDYNKPLSEQSEQIRQRLFPLVDQFRKEMPEGFDVERLQGAGVLRVVGVTEDGNQINARLASERLLAAGIPGIRFLDGNSRSAGEGSSNYVIFDEDLVRILEENGQPVETNSERSFSVMASQDAEYLNLAKGPEKNRSRLQVMVDAAASDIDRDVFKHIYLKNEKRFKDAVESGRARKGVPISDFLGKAVMLHQPDAAFSGGLKFQGKTVVKGTGGVYYPMLFGDGGDFWASTQSAAESMAASLNEISVANGGKIYMALTSAPIHKLFSSTTMATGMLDILARLSASPDVYGISEQNLSDIIAKASQIRLKKKVAGKVTVKTFSKTLSESAPLKKNLAEIKRLLKPEASTFDVRYGFARSVAKQVAATLKGKEEASKKFASLLTGESNLYAKGAIRKGKLSEEAIIQGFSDLFAEPFLKAFQSLKKGGHIYAIIEMDGLVEAVKTSNHESYGFSIRSTSGKKPTVHLIDKSMEWHDVIGIRGQAGYISEADHKKVYPTSGVSSKKHGVLEVKAPRPGATHSIDITTFSVLKKNAKEIKAEVDAMSSDEIRSALEKATLTPTLQMVELLGEFPEYLTPVVDYIMSKREALINGTVSVRDVAKAYWITVASIGADAINVDTIRQQADALGIPFDPSPMFLSYGKKGQAQMRPEELAAWWLGTPEGQTALDNIQAGKFNQGDWATGLKMRDAFGRNDLNEKTTKSGSYVAGGVGAPKPKKFNLRNVTDLVEQINAAKGNPAKLEKALMSLNNIAEGKKGFIGHMLGFGEWATLDAVELNIWLTGKGSTTYQSEAKKRIAAIAKKASGSKALSKDLFGRIRKRINALRGTAKGGTAIPEEVAAHVIHHWIWDRAKGIETTHQGVYHAMATYSVMSNDLSEYKGWNTIEVTKEGRVFSPIVRDLLQRRADGEDIPRELIDEAIRTFFPSRLVQVPESPEDLPTRAEIDEAILKTKGEKVMERVVPKGAITPGEEVTMRQDVPSMTKFGLGVVTIRGKLGASYEAMGRILKPRFELNEKETLKIGLGSGKQPHIKIVGAWAEDQTMPADLKDWTQVGFNPDRHSFYYERATMRQVTGGSEAFQIGNTVFVKDPVFGDGNISPISYSVLSNAESRIADQYNPLFRDPDKRRKILVEGQKRVREKAKDFDDIVRSGRTVERLDREQATREGVIYGDLLVQYFNADTEEKVNALPPVDRKAARSEAKRQAEAWRKMQDRQQKKIPRETMVAALRTLDAMISALPVELRGKIGGMVKIATLTEPGAMVNELETRLKRLDDVLEAHLKKEANDGVKKLFEIAKPARDESGKARKGKAGADIHDLFETVKRAKKLWSVDDAEAHALGLEAIVAAGNLTPEEEAHKLLEAELVRMFGGWNDVYADSGKVDKNGRPIKVKVRDGAGAERRNAALDLATDVWKAGYFDYQIKKKAEADRREQQRTSLRVATGKAGLESETRKAEAIGLTWAGGLKEKFFSLLNFEQLVTWVFGDNEVGRWFINEQRRAENQKIDEVQQVADGIEDLFTSLAGGNRFAGEKLHYEMTQRSLTATSETGDVVPLSELEAISALLMWMQEDGKRHLKGKRDENGKIVSKWAYGQDFIDEIYSKLSKNGDKVLTFLINQYSQEYEPLNAVYKEIYGINMPRNANYSPLLVKPQQAGNGQTVDPTTGNTVSAGSFTPGSLRTRAQVSAQPDFRDSIATYLSHKKQIAHWKANAVLMREASGVIGNRDLGDSVSASSGKEAVKILRKWIDMIAQGGNRDAAAGTALVDLYDRMVGRAASMALVGRVGTLLIQSTQIMAASAAMPTSAFVMRLSKLLTGNLKWRDALDSPYMQRRLKAAPVHVQLAMEGLRASEPTRLKHAVREAGQLLSATDARFTSGTYAIVYDYQLKQAKKRKASDPVAEAHAETERIVENLAQPTRMGTRSFYELSATSPIAKLSWAFGSDARKNLALLGYTLAKGNNTEKARAFLFVVLLNGVLAGVVRNAWRDLRDDEDDEIFDEKYWNIRRIALSASTDWLFGFPVIGEEIQGAIFAAAGEYRPDSGLFSSIAAAPGAFKNLFIDFDSTDVLRDVEKIATAVGLFNDSAAAGVSVLHIIRDVFDLGSNLIPD
jgi:hypothetical protein